METGLSILKLSLYLSLVTVGSCARAPTPTPTPTPAPLIGMRPGSCEQYECPSYKLVEAGYAYEIRFYDSAVWMNTDPIPAASMVQATKTGLQRLFSYIQGNNNKHLKIKITSPTMTQVTPAKSLYTVSFYLPKKLQMIPPQATNLTVHSSEPTYAAVRQIGGLVSDEYAKNEVAALMDSLKGSDWITAIEKSKGKSPEYLIADYNPPAQARARVSEILVPFTM